MKAFLKRLVLFLGIAGMLLIIVGCGGGGKGGGGGGGLDNAETKQAIAARINSFKTAVEAYDVQGMLDFLEKNPPEEPLTIAEGASEPYPKSYGTLETELTEDEPNQLGWRKPPSEGGNGYTLTMELGTIAYSNLAASGAFATVPFTIIEAAQKPFIEPRTTDEGHMVCEMVKLQGTWRCRKMTIHFNPVEASSSSMASSVSLASYQAASRAGSSKKKTKGFGFGDPETFLKNNGLL